MVEATADRVRLSRLKEVTYGVTPGASNLLDLRITNEDLQQNTSTTESNEIDAGRQTNDIIRTNAEAEGPINFELSYGAFDDLFEAVVYSAGWSTEQAVAASTIAFAGATITDSANGFGSFVANQWVMVSGSVSNDGFYKIQTVAAGVLTLVNGAALITAETAGATITVSMGPQVVNGVTQSSFTIEKAYTDLANAFAVYRGTIFESMDISFDAENPVTGSFGTKSRLEESATSSVGAGYSAAPTNPIMNSVDHMEQVFESGSRIDVSNFSAALQNNVRSRKVAGTFGPRSRAAGKINASGNVTMYLEDAALINKYLAFNKSSIATGFRDENGNGLLLEFPSIKYISGKRTAGGINTDVMAEFSYKAYKDSVEGITVRIVRFPAP